jgi:hypothetical protein
MKRSSKIAVGIAAALTLGLGTAVSANQAGPGPGAHAKGGMQHSMKGGMGHHGMRHEAGDRGAANQLMTPEERTALREKLRNAAPEERQKIAQTTRAQMQARAQENGVTLPQHRGARAGAATAAPGPTTNEHAH